MDSQHSLITITEVARLFGTTPAYITYLVRRGALHGRKIGRRTYLSRKAVMSMFADLNDTISAQRELKSLYNEIDTQRQQLRDELNDAADNSSLVHFLRRIPYSRDIVLAILAASGKLDGRQLDIIADLLSGSPVSDVADRFGIGNCRIQQLAHNAIRTFSQLPSYASLELQISKLTADKTALAKETETLLSENTELRRALNIRASAPEADLAQLFLLHTPISSMNLSNRAKNCIRCMMGADTLGDLLQFSKTDLLKFRGLGRKTFDEIDRMVGSLGLHWGMDTAALRRKYAITLCGQTLHPEPKEPNMPNKPNEPIMPIKPNKPNEPTAPNKPIEPIRPTNTAPG